MSTKEPSTTELIELRQYLLHGGQRDVLIELFDREFVEAQEEVGMDVLGQFRDVERPDYFVWIRGFPNMAARHESLGAFYGGPVWRRHKAAANSTMIDSSNVMLLRSISSDRALPIHMPKRRDTCTTSGHVVVVAEHVDLLDDETIASFTSEVIPLLMEAGCRTLGTYASEKSPNTFTRLPVRTDRSIVWIGATETGDPCVVRQAIPPMPGRQVECHILTPTSRSALDGTTR